jgi:6-phosphogluconolactonase/glucosamine-6-phosphate isomerase/deaminase
MGPDGHTASIFPNDPASEVASKETKQLIFNTNAPAHPTQRITCSAALLFSSRNLLLMLTGAQKLDVYEHAAQAKLPIASFQKHIDQIYYSAS